MTVNGTKTDATLFHERWIALNNIKYLCIENCKQKQWKEKNVEIIFVNTYSSAFDFNDFIELSNFWANLWMRRWAHSGVSNNMNKEFRAMNMKLSRFNLIAPFTKANVILKCRESNASRSSTLLLLEEFLTFQKFMKFIEMINWALDGVI